MKLLIFMVIVGVAALMTDWKSNPTPPGYEIPSWA